MDFITHDGLVYAIQFCYKPGIPPNGFETVRSTSCSIVSGDDVQWGYSWCHRNDQFSKETGRKLALTRALINRDRSFRTAAWKAYFERKGG